MLISSEKLSTRFFEVNSCNIQHLIGRDYHMLRREGRVDYHILYIIEGICYVVENGEETPVRAGNIILYHPHERQEYRFFGKDATRSAYIHFSGTNAGDLLAAAGLSARVTPVGNAAVLERLFRETAEEWCLKKPYFQENATALFLQFLAMAARHRAYEEQAVTPALQHSMDAVLRYMHRHYDENHDVAFFAAMCHQSAGRFAHAFKESTGTSPKHYMLQIKVDIACHLLATTTLSVAEVAEAVGIFDVNYFSRLIKKFTGRPPRNQR